jgi:maltose O-acetyltransferase
MLNSFGHGLISRIRGDADTRGLKARGLTLGENVYINASARLDGGFLWLIAIGDDSVIGPEVRILAHDASMKRHVGYTKIAPVEIGCRVFVGAGSLILPGVTIGDDAVVGAGSVIRHDVAAGTVVIGNPPVVAGSSDDYFARHREQIESGPRWPADGSTNGAISEREREELRRAIGRGVGYIA